MTELKRAIRRKVTGVLREALIVTVYPGGVIGIRAHRTRREYQLPLVTIYKVAIEVDLARQRAERIAARLGTATKGVSRGLLRRG